MTATATPEPGRTLEFALLGLLALFWGSAYLFVGIAVQEIPPLTLIACRVSIATLILGTVMVAQGARLPRDGRTWRRLLLQGFCNAIIPWPLLAWGQQHIDSSLAAVLNSTAPIWVFLMVVFVTRHESTAPRRLAGAVLGLGGVTMIVGIEALSGLGEQVAGQLAALGGAILYGVAAINGKRFTDISPTAVAFGTMLWAVLFIVPASLIVDRPWTLSPSFDAMAATAALGVFCTGGALLIYFRLVRTLGSMGVASQAYLRSGIAVMLGVVFLDETITPLVGLGLAAAIAGVALINLPSRRAGQ